MMETLSALFKTGLSWTKQQLTPVRIVIFIAVFLILLIVVYQYRWDLINLGEQRAVEDRLELLEREIATYKCVDEAVLKSLSETQSVYTVEYLQIKNKCTNNLPSRNNIEND